MEQPTENCETGGVLSTVQEAAPYMGWPHM